MGNFTNALQWENQGTAPSETLRETGFQGGYKPPAPVMNYFLNKTGVCITELQETLTSTNTSVAELQGKVDEKTGVKVESGINVRPSYTTTATTGTGAEIFNDYRERLFNSNTKLAYQGNVASGDYSHAEGGGTGASGKYSHAEGSSTVASGFSSHAEGGGTITSGSCSHAEGWYTTASGDYSHAEGNNTTASGEHSHAGGFGTVAKDFQFVTGKFNTEYDGCTAGDDQSADSTIFIIGNGTTSTKSNAFRISAAGKCYGTASFSGSGADFAERFEWVDGNPNNEDRRGKIVTLDGEKIRYANADDEYILGVISSAEAFVGNSASEEWQGRWLKDVFGERLTKEVEIPEEKDEKTGKIIPAHTVIQFVQNPDYNPNEEYVSREFRKEWACVGLLGQVVVEDDGSCIVGKYCKPSTNGIGTAAESGYRVMRRIDENHIKVLVR